MAQGMLKIANQAWKTLISLKFAVMVMVALTISLIVATFIESNVDTKTAQYYVYRTWWFFALLGSFGALILAVAISRWPWKKKHTPFLMAHAGILMILIGSWLTYSKGIDGSMQLTEGDVREQGRFEDSIGIFPEFIDGYGYLILPTTGRYFHVPYRSMLPKGVRNLIVTGRVIGGDKVSHAAVRNMMCCAVAGQGAGVAAALSVKSGCDFNDVDLVAVQSELRRQGARIA